MATLISTTRLLIAGSLAAIGVVSGLTTAHPAHADNIGYLINSGVSYGQPVNNIKADFNTSDEFQASYLISQSAQELCPAAIWQLRQSTAGYVPPA